MEVEAKLLAEHRFQELFVQHLGWDRSTASLEIPVAGRVLSLRAVAKKGGVQVLICDTDSRTIASHRLLRQVRRIVAKSFDDHILVYVSSTPRSQEWEWVVQLDNGRRFRHRDHPFHSSEPPPKLIARLSRLRFSGDENISESLFDATHQIRSVLDTTSRCIFFENHPWYAQRSIELLHAARAGDRAAYEKFIELHSPLVRMIATTFAWAYRLDKDDVSQCGMLGLLRAADYFDPDRGIEFATYARWCIRQTCKKFCAESSHRIRIPIPMVWLAFRTRRQLDAAFGLGGPLARRRRLQELSAEDPLIARYWVDFERCHDLRSLSISGSPESRASRRIISTDERPEDVLHQREVMEKVRIAFSRVRPHLRDILRWRCGLDGDAMTLEQLANKFRESKQRICQLELQGLEELLKVVKSMFPELVDEYGGSAKALGAHQSLVKPMSAVEFRRSRGMLSICRVARFNRRRRSYRGRVAEGLVTRRRRSANRR